MKKRIVILSGVLAIVVVALLCAIRMWPSRTARPIRHDTVGKSGHFMSHQVNAAQPETTEEPGLPSTASKTAGRHGVTRKPKQGSNTATAKQLRAIQMDRIRKGQPPLPIQLTKEMDEQLVREGVLPKSGPGPAGVIRFSKRSPRESDGQPAGVIRTKKELPIK